MPDELTEDYWRRKVRVNLDGIRRADKGLRTFAIREGDAVMCRKCDGAGVIMHYPHRMTEAEPLKCTRCGGDGLELPE